MNHYKNLSYLKYIFLLLIFLFKTVNSGIYVIDQILSLGNEDGNSLAYMLFLFPILYKLWVYVLEIED